MPLVSILIILLFTHICSQAQVKPNWVNDLRGPSGNAVATFLAVDKQNNIYVTGYFRGTVDFDPSSGVKNLTSIGGDDVFVGEYSQNGTLIWIESMGGTQDDRSTGLTVDKDGNISICGFFESAIFDADPGPGVYDLSNPYSPDNTAGFVIHLNNNGSFVWANAVAGGDLDFTWQVSSDSQGNIITTSQFSNHVTVGDSTIAASGSTTALITKYSPSGKVLWFLHFNGTPFTSAYGVAIDSGDNIVVSGLFTGKVNFNYLGATPYNLLDPNTTLTEPYPSAFIAKYTSTGTFLWANSADSKFLFDGAYSTVAVDKQNNVYFSAFFGVSLIFGETTITFTGDAQQACIAKYSSAGVFEFAKPIGAQQGAGYFGGISDVNQMSFDANDHLYLTGYFRNTVNFNANNATPVNLTAQGYDQDFYVAKYDTLANCLYAFNAGGSCDSTVASCASIDGNNNIDVAGGFCSTVNFDPSGCYPQSVTAEGSTDPFIAQYSYINSSIATNTITPPSVTSFCSTGNPLSITGSLPTGGDGSFTYQWQTSADSVNFTNVNGATGQNYMPSTITSTSYYQRIVNSGGCPSPPPAIISNIVSLKVLPVLASPVVTVAATTSSSVVFTWSAISGATGYQISTNGGQSHTTVNTLADTVTNLQPGQSVTITVDASGVIPCQLSVSATATGSVPASDVLFVANAFTPNADGRDDILHVKGENIQSLKFSIYDQWGELLFTSTNQQNGWDGTYKGNKEPVGVYVYYVEAVMNDGTSIKKKGTVTLLK